MSDPRLSMSERDLENAVRRILKDLPRIWARHESDSRGAVAGWPDWVFLRRAEHFGGAVMFRELKTAKGCLTAAQQECLAYLKAAGLDADVYRPADLLSGRIARELAALAGLPVAREAS
jgi:VRR-NUC domain